MSASLPGEHLTLLAPPTWRGVLLQMFAHASTEQPVLVPAVAEPLVVWVLSGSARVEERALDGEWQASEVHAGDFFLTTATDPYEMRWRTLESDRFEVMHLYLDLQLLERATRDVLGDPYGYHGLRDVSGGQDATLSCLLDQLRLELTTRREPSELFIQGIAQSLAVHLVRTYLDSPTRPWRRNALPAIKLHRVIQRMQAGLSEAFSLECLAQVAGLSPYHFSRLFKQATGLSPSHYFIRLRIDKARQLLTETERSVIDIGLDVGYTSPSHFSQVFRRETGRTPSQYRHG